MKLTFNNQTLSFERKNGLNFQSEEKKCDALLPNGL